MSSRTTEEHPPPASADSLAYVGIARASGALRASAAGAALGRSGVLADRRSLTAARDSLGSIRPRDPALVVLDQQIDGALSAALAAHRDPAAQHAAALAAITATQRINGGLDRYARRHPELQQLVPD